MMIILKMILILMKKKGGDDSYDICIQMIILFLLNVLITIFIHVINTFPKDISIFYLFNNQDPKVLTLSKTYLIHKGHFSRIISNIDTKYSLDNA